MDKNWDRGDYGNRKREINWLAGSAIGIDIYSVKEIPTRTNDDMLEIVFCLKGSVKFSYVYDEFLLNEGEYVSVDKDAFFLTDGSEDNICVSIFIDLKKYTKEYPYILTSLFICEGAKSAEKGYIHTYPKASHRKLKGILISFLAYITSSAGPERRKITAYSDAIIDLFISDFDILGFYVSRKIIDDDLQNLHRKMSAYIFENAKEQLTIKELSTKFGFSEGYISKLLTKFGLCFQKQLAYLRATFAERYLLYTDMTILEISSECGFSDAKYFYKAMREWYHCTPWQFRKLYKGRTEKVASKIDINEIKPIVHEILEKHYYELFSPITRNDSE